MTAAINAKIVNKQGAIPYVGGTPHWGWTNVKPPRLPYHFYRFIPGNIPEVTANDDFTEWLSTAPVPDNYGSNMLIEGIEKSLVVEVFCDSISLQNHDVLEIISGDGSINRPFRNIYLALRYLGCLVLEPVHNEHLACHAGMPIYFYLHVTGVIDYSFDDFSKKCGHLYGYLAPQYEYLVLDFDGCQFDDHGFYSLFNFSMSVHCIRNLKYVTQAPPLDSGIVFSSDVIDKCQITYTGAAQWSVSVNCGAILDSQIMFLNGADDTNAMRFQCFYIVRSMFDLSGLVQIVAGTIVDSSFRFLDYMPYSNDRRYSYIRADKGYNVQVIGVTEKTYPDRWYDWQNVDIRILCKSELQSVYFSADMLYNSKASGTGGAIYINKSELECYTLFGELKNGAYGEFLFASLISSEVKVTLALPHLINNDIADYMIAFSNEFGIGEHGFPLVCLDSNVELTFRDNKIYSYGGYAVYIRPRYNSEGLPIAGQSFIMANSNITYSNSPVLDSEHGNTPCVWLDDVFDKYNLLAKSNSTIERFCISSSNSTCCNNF